MEVITLILSALCLILLTVLLFRKEQNDVNPMIGTMQQLMQRELKENREELSNSIDRLPQKLPDL